MEEGSAEEIDLSAESRAEYTLGHAKRDPNNAVRKSKMKNGTSSVSLSRMTS